MYTEMKKPNTSKFRYNVCLVMILHIHMFTVLFMIQPTNIWFCTSTKSKYILTILFIIFPNHLFMEAKNKGVHPSCLWWLILHPRWTRAWTRFVCPFELAKDNGDSPSAFNKSKSFYKILNFIKVLLITTSRYICFYNFCKLLFRKRELYAWWNEHSEMLLYLPHFHIFGIL